MKMSKRKQFEQNTFYYFYYFFFVQRNYLICLVKTIESNTVGAQVAAGFGVDCVQISVYAASRRLFSQTVAFTLSTSMRSKAPH